MILMENVWKEVRLLVSGSLKDLAQKGGPGIHVASISLYEIKIVFALQLLQFYLVSFLSSCQTVKIYISIDEINLWKSIY